MSIRHCVYILTILWISLNASPRHIAVVTNPIYAGESAFAYRIQRACKNIGWQADLIEVQNPEKLAFIEYDFVICIVQEAYPHPSCKNYQVIFAPKSPFFRSSGTLQQPYHSFDGYLLSFAPQPYHAEFFEEHPYLQWYPTAYAREYEEVTLSHLFHTCATWGDRFNDKKFQKLFSLLDQEPYVQFYGRAQVARLCPKHYQGPIPFDEESLYKTAAQAGISLLIHSTIHNKHGIPSGRIFEAAASSTVIISDQNPFIQKHFEDAVLYIDTTEDSLSIFKQIQNHMQWISNNPIAALEKAKKAHQIFTEEFLLEDQLLKLEEFHEKITRIGDST